MTRVLITALMALSIASVFAAEVQEDKLEREVLEIGKELRCAVCQNQSISDSNADLARDMRDVIREQLKAGKPRAEILQYFVDRYGNYVLMKPPAHGTGTLLWVMPGLFAVVLVVTALVFLRQRKREALPPPPKLSKADLDRVHSAREHGES